MSHPTWVRGLKLYLLAIIPAFLKSHPTWVRGLKLVDEVVAVRGVRRTLRGCVD